MQTQVRHDKIVGYYDDVRRIHLQAHLCWRNHLDDIVKMRIIIFRQKYTVAAIL